MIIDGHVHIGTAQFLQVHADAEMLLRWADELGFERLFCTDVGALWYDMREGNDRLGRDLLRHGDRLIGYVTIPSPRFGPAAVEEIRRCHEEYGMRGVKIYSHPEAPVTESAMYAILEAAAERRMPVLSHTTPAECDELMRHVPEVWLIMAHMGGQPYAFGDWHRAVEVAERHRNLFLDTASSQIDNGMIEHAVERLGPERILFGTDMPLLDPYVQRAKIEGAAIPEEARRLILGDNLRRLLRL